MPGNSRRRGATRKRQAGNPTAGSGARRRKQLEGAGPTPKAADRPNHKAYKQKRASERRRSINPGPRPTTASSEWIAGRNAVVEALQARIPVTAMYVAERAEHDDRMRLAFALGAQLGASVLEVPRAELDRLTDGAVHQGIALKMPSYDYADPDELADRAADSGDVPLIVALDKITDPRNLGAIIRSAAAFGAHGVVVPERRSAPMTASAWKASAGAAARLPVARTTNLTRQLQTYQKAGFTVAGLDAGAARGMDDVDPSDPLVLVVGAEGGGLSRLVRETCDLLVGVPMRVESESLNAGVAAGIALYEVARARR